MTDKAKVTAVPTTWEIGGQKYGPFHASPETPFTEVPSDLQVAAGLPLYRDSEAPAAPATGNDAPVLRTGDLPGNFVAVGTLKAAGITTFEGLREKDQAALTALGLTEEQAEKALVKAKDPLGSATGLN